MDDEVMCPYCGENAQTDKNEIWDYVCETCGESFDEDDLE